MTTEETNRLKVIVCRPLEKAEVIEINDDLDTMQSLVGGMIEEYMPFVDEHDPRVEDVAIICDDEGINPDYIRLFLGQEDIMTTWGHYLYDRRNVDENRRMLNRALSEDTTEHDE